MFSRVHRTSEDVDIYQLPQEKSRNILPPGAELTIGDLHGNFIKLLYSLIEQGIAYNLSVDEYQRLVNLYKLSLEDNDAVRFWHILEFKSLVGKLKFRQHATLRLIGDETADRGANDYFTLFLLKQLHDKGVATEILLSNHGYEFIHAYETSSKNFKPTRFISDQFSSVLRMVTLVSKGLVKAEEITDIIETVYKPWLKILSYTLNEAADEITLYSHAGIGLETIRETAKLLGVVYKDATCTDLAATIDAINAEFKKYVDDNRVHEIATIREGTIFDIMWNRDYSGLERPKIHNQYRINYVHGHDRNELSSDYIFTLDNLLGHAQIYNNHIGKQPHHISNPHLREPEPLLSDESGIEVADVQPAQLVPPVYSNVMGAVIESGNNRTDDSTLILQLKKGRPIAIVENAYDWQLNIYSQSGEAFFFNKPSDCKGHKLTLENFSQPFLDNILALPGNGRLISKIKSQFLFDLNHKLTTEKLSRTDILTLFEQLQHRDGVYKIIHHQRHSGWDTLRLFLKFGCNRAPGEDKIWQTATYQKAVKLLKNAYLNLEGNVDPSHAEREKAFIDYRRGNAPVTFGETQTRKLMSNL